jgi:hypothetical protein
VASVRERPLPPGPVGCPYHLGIDLACHVGVGQLARSSQLLAEHVCLPRDLSEGSGQAGLNA